MFGINRYISVIAFFVFWRCFVRCPTGTHRLSNLCHRDGCGLMFWMVLFTSIFLVGVAQSFSSEQMVIKLLGLSLMQMQAAHRLPQ